MVFLFHRRASVVAGKYVVILRLVDLCDVLHAAVADFHGMAVESLWSFKPGWIYADEPDKPFADPVLTFRLYGGSNHT